ncbi:type I polyketide synthase [Spirillospora albida]|uniref:type I polyketide synthase n=1 Tax=Spirillospora albida TaxID=58123 RepID=UPI0005625F6F|nr:type I polyketide synthase [Spirillospora albida]
MPEAKDPERRYMGLEIAVIGMAGRFPEAEDLDRFWTNLVAGVDAISHFSVAELRGTGVSEEALDHPGYVRAKGAFPGIEFFDSAFFGYTPADATMLDPQVRALHEEVYHALEDAGYSAEARTESIGLFLGATNNLAWEWHTLSKYVRESELSFSGTQLNDKDYAATRIAYALGLKGPAFTLHSACSTSLIAIDSACRHLWTGACQIAVAGGSGLTLPHKNGYLYQENMIHSPDGRCRAFDREAGGTVEGNGAGVVVLKRLETALRDGDRVHAVIRGSAVNNDGDRKVGYTAPSIEGQAEVIRKAYRVANVSPADVSYVETHGTGTSLGDPVEVEALRKAFGSASPATCGIGSLKASVGHLDTAAGVASFIKACKILEHRTAPRSLHFTAPNPNIDFIDGPFYVVDRTQRLERRRTAEQAVLPLRAGVSSFGIGGSNAHVVLEEPPRADAAAPAGGREYNTLVVSATSAEAIRRIKRNLVDHLAAHPDVDGADLAWTMQNRQRRLAYRYAVEFRDTGQLAERLRASLDADQRPARLVKNARADVHFVFSGAEAAHLGMARGLYAAEESFRSHLDACFSILEPDEGTQTLLFMVEYALARTLIGWGIKPKGMIGHGVGELAAACVSGVLSPEDGIRLARARDERSAAPPAGISLRPPKIPFVSGVTGTWITAEQATDPAHWTQAREAVRFEDGVEVLLERGSAVIVEVGPGRSLSSFIRGGDRGARITAVNALPGTRAEIEDDEHVARVVGELWEAGVALDWKAYHRGREPRKVSLPLYPFDKIEYPVDVTGFQRLYSDPGEVAPASAAGADAVAAPALRMVWSELALPEGKEQQRTLIVFTDDAVKLRSVLEHVPHWRAIYVEFGARYEFRGGRGATVRDHDQDDLARLVEDLQDHALAGDTFVVHRTSYSSTITLMRRLRDAASAMRRPCVRDLVVLDTGDFLRRRADFLPRVLGLNHEAPDLRITAFRGDPRRRGPDAPEAWARCLQAELEARRPDAVAVRYEGGLRRVPLMVPVQERHDPRHDRARRTVIVCRACIADDVAGELAHGDPTRAIQVLPVELRPDPVPASESAAGGRVTVLPAVVEGSWKALRAALSARLRDLTPMNELVLWDERVPEGTGGDGTVDRRALHGLLGELSRELRTTCHVLARPRLDRGGWDGEVTRWFAETEVSGTKAGFTRLYSFGRAAEGDRSVLDLLSRMSEAGIDTAYHGLDPLRAQSAAKTVAPVGEGATGAERDAIAAVIERELARLLGYSEIDPSADMMDIGLDSVKLVQFTNALERNGHKVLHGDVYNHPTVDSLAGLLAGRTAERTGGDADSFERIAERLRANLGRECAFQEFSPAAGADPLVLLFVEGLDDDLRKRVVRELNALRPPGALQPHHILPRALEERFLADRDFASLGIGAGPDPRGAELKAIFDEIDRRQENLRTSIAAQPVKWTYPISGMQKRHFASEARLQLYLIRFERLLDVDVLERAFADVVGRHGLMRSFLSRSFRRFRWREFEAPDTIALPRMDLSHLDPPQQEELRAELVDRELETDFKVVDRPMYQVVLLKYNERSYDLLFQFDHSIFDATSGQTLRGDLLRRYEELLGGSVRAMPAAKSYRHLQDQIRKGPVGITPEQIVERFELERYARHTKIIQEKAAPYADARIQAVRHSIDLNGFRAADGGELETFSLVVHLYARVVARLMDVDEVALNILFGSRVFEDEDYSEVMGMVLGGLPVVVSGRRGARDELNAVIRDKVRMMNKNNVSFLDLVHDLKSLVRYREVLLAVKDVLGGSAGLTCLVNFVGNVEAEYDAVWDLMLEQLAGDQSKLDYADCYCVSKINDGRLDLLILCKWVQAPDELAAILTEEVEHLRPEPLR